MARKRTLLPVVTLLAAAFAGPLHAATDVLTLVPNKALAVVMVNRIGETSEKLEHLAQRVKAPFPGPLARLKKAAGIEHGFNEQGSMLVALMAPDGKITKPRLVAAVPVSDYAKFVSQFGGDGSETITEVTVAGERDLAGDRATTPYWSMATAARCSRDCSRPAGRSRRP